MTDYSCASKQDKAYKLDVAIPIVSKVCEFAKMPSIDKIPWEGLNPNTPQKAEGILTPPTVSVPAHNRLINITMILDDNNNTS